MKAIFKKILKILWQTVCFLFAVVVLTLILKVFVVESFKIPSYSMSPALVQGDFVFVNKLTLGARLYTFADTDTTPVNITRVWGFCNIQRGDVLVFNFPYRDNRKKIEFNHSIFYIKRCIALAGDTLRTVDGFYKVSGCNDSLGSIERQRMLSKKSERDYPKDVFRIFPKDSPYHYWTMKNAGPLYVPQKDAVVAVDSVSFYLYRRLIEYETGQKLCRENSGVLLGDSAITEYRFSRNYYFMAGDNALDSNDSRYWGLLPEEMIVGKAAFIWKSIDPKTDKRRWNRVFKMISS
jgi:signal peptidase I